MCCPVEYVVDKVSLRVQALEIMCETKTLDNVFVSPISKLYRESYTRCMRKFSFPEPNCMVLY
jgi:hypothetical protein